MLAETRRRAGDRPARARSRCVLSWRALDPPPLDRPHDRPRAPVARPRLRERRARRRARGAGYRFWAFQHHCYSDVIALHGDRYLGGGRPRPVPRGPHRVPGAARPRAVAPLVRARRRARPLHGDLPLPRGLPRRGAPRARADPRARRRGGSARRPPSSTTRGSTGTSSPSRSSPSRVLADSAARARDERRARGARRLGEALPGALRPRRGGGARPRRPPRRALLRFARGARRRDARSR